MMGAYLHGLSGAGPSVSASSSPRTSIASSSSCSESDRSTCTNITPPTSASTSTFPESLSKEASVAAQGEQRGRSPARSAPPALRAESGTTTVQDMPMPSGKMTARHRSRLLLDLVVKGQVPLDALLAFPIDFTRLAQQGDFTSVARPRCPKSASAGTIEGARRRMDAAPRSNRPCSGPSITKRSGMPDAPPSRKRQRRCIDLPEENSFDTVSTEPKRQRLQASDSPSISPPSSTQSLPTLGSLRAQSPPSLLERRRRKSRPPPHDPDAVAERAPKRLHGSEPPVSYGCDDSMDAKETYQLALEHLPRPPVIEVVFVEMVKLDGCGGWTVCPPVGAAQV